MSAPEPPQSPYKGLVPFEDTELDERFFFGRERETELVSANLMASRLTVLYGPSGVGKSSLLRAGVARRLRSLVPAGAEDPVSGVGVAIVDGWRDDPIAAIAAAAGVELPDGMPLADLLAERAAALGGELYLMLDQMDEYFLYHGHDRAARLPAELEEVLTRPELRVHVLLGVRDDALAELDTFKARLPGLYGNVLRLDHLDRDAARSAILGPLEQYAQLGGPRVTAEPELFEAVLDQVAAGQIEQGLGGRGTVTPDAARERVEAPFLQLVLERLWAEERSVGSDALRVETLRRLGGAERIVEEHLERALAGLSADEKDVAARIFNHLVTPSGTKIAHGASDLANYAGGPVEDLLSRLALERILRPLGSSNGGEPRYEIFHDVLADAVLEWRARHESERQLETERAMARHRHRRLVLLTTLALVALAGTGVLAVWALSQRAAARDKARTAEARELAASALSELAVDPQRSLRLALDAAELEPSDRTEDVLRRALLESRLLRVAKVPEPVEALARGSIIGGSSGKALQFDERLAVVGSHELPGRLLELRVDGAVVVSGRTLSIVDPTTGRVERRVRIPKNVLPVRDVETGTLVQSIPAPKSIRYAAVGPDRTLIAISDGSPRTVIVNALTGEGRHVIEQSSNVTALRFGPAARTLAVGGNDGTIHLWRVSTGERRAILRNGHVGRVVDIAFSPRATLLATASTDGTARVWRVGSAEAISVLSGHENLVNDVDFSPDGSFVVTAGKDGTARVWRAKDGEALATLRGHGDSVRAATFLHGGGRVVTAGADGTVRLWNAVRQPLLQLVRTFGKPVRRVRFAPGGFKAVTADDRLHVLGSDGRILEERAATPTSPERSSDGATVTKAGKNAVVRRPGGRELVLSGHRDRVTSAHFSANGAYVVTASRDGDSIIWSARNGARVRKLLGHFAIVSDARFSPDGRWIVTAGPRTAGLWSASTGALVYLLQGHKGRLLSAAFDSTSRRIVTGGLDGTVRTYRCAICGDLDALIELARQRLASIARP